MVSAQPQPGRGPSASTCTWSSTPVSDRRTSAGGERRTQSRDAATSAISGDRTQAYCCISRASIRTGLTRLPTGGVRQGEAVLETLARSPRRRACGWEKARRKRTCAACWACCRMRLAHRGLGVSYAFATYHFLVEFRPGAVLNPQDPEERIAGWQWRTPVELGRVADTLEATGKNAPYWADWGRWRALSHRFVARALG